MRIWVVYTYEPIPAMDGGGARFRYGELAHHLRLAGHEVHWWQSTFDHVNKRHRAQTSVSMTMSDGLRLHLAHGPGYSRNVSINRVFHNRAVAHETARMMAEQEMVPDIVVIGLPSIEVAENVATYCTSKEIPFVIDAHDMWPDIYLRIAPRGGKWLLRLALAGEFAKAKRVFRSATACTAVSETYLKWILARGGRLATGDDRVFPLGYKRRSPIGRDQEAAWWEKFRRTHRIPEGKFFVVFVGTFGHFYDVETIVEVAATAAPLDASIHFILAGAGDKWQTIRERSAALPNVTLTGRIAQDDVWILLRHSSVALSAYTDGATQSLPYKPFEYMAAGLPQLCSLRGEISALLFKTRSGAGYSAGNAGDLYAKIQRLKNRPEVRAYMARRAVRVFDAAFDMTVIHDEMRRYLEGVAERRAKKARKSPVSGKRIRILYVHQHFATPEGSTGTRSYEFSRALLADGHDVTMLCGASVLAGLSIDDASIWRSVRGNIDGIDVVAVPLRYSNHDGLIHRALVFVRFACHSSWIAMTGKYDLLFATSTPLTVGLPGLVSKLVRPGTPFLFEIRDLWPEIPKALGVKNRFVLGGMSILEWLCYRCADACIGLSPGMVRGIERRAPRQKIWMIPNGCDLDLFKSKADGTFEFPGLESSDFVAAFMGAHGKANGLGALLDVAAELKRRSRNDIKILMIGDGLEKPHLMHRAQIEQLDNCIFMTPQKKTDLARLASRADCGLMVFANVPALYYGTSPNKFFDYLALGIPVINNYPGWLADMIGTDKCGLVVPPGEPARFADALERLADHPAERREMGANARRLGEREFARKNLAGSFIEALHYALGRGRDEGRVI